MKLTKNANRCIIVLVAVLYAINRIYLKQAIDTPVLHYILNCHFNDYLAGIAIICYINLALDLFGYRERTICTYRAAILTTLACGLVWEYALPALFPHGTSDLYDMVSYLLGGCTYIFLPNTIAKTKHKCT